MILILSIITGFIHISVNMKIWHFIDQTILVYSMNLRSTGAWDAESMQFHGSTQKHFGDSDD